MSLYSGITIPGHPAPENIRKLDLLPLPMIRRMQRYGIAINRDYFRDLTGQLSREMDDLRIQIACQIPPEKLDIFCNRAMDIDDWSPINVESGQQLAELLFDVLEIGRGKQLKMTASGDRISTGKKQLEILKKEHPVVQLVLNYRERSKLVSTYSSKFPEIARLHPRGECPVCGLRHVESTYRIHTQITTTRTDTGRLASKSPNIMNIPSRSDLGRRVREGFIPSPGCRLVSRDFSGIELRMLAHCAVEHSMIQAFINKLDLHTQTAMRAFKIADPKAVDKLLHRAPAKTASFLIVYGGTGAGLYDAMAVIYATAKVPMPDWLTVEWCDKFIADWFDVYPGARKYMDDQSYRARRYSMVWDQFGRVRRIPEARSALGWIRNAGIRQAGNMPIQSISAGLLKLVMGEVEERLLDLLDNGGVWCWPLIPIHDELLLEVEEDWADAVGEMVGDVMGNVMTDRKTGRNLCRVPIESDGKSMDRWMKE